MANQTAISKARANVARKAKTGIGVTLHTNGKPIKGLAAEPVLAKPQRKMLRAIATINGHIGKGNCIKRFHLYKVGDTLLKAKTTQGMVVSDLTYWAQCKLPNGKPYIVLREPTDAEYNAAVKAWEAAQVKAKAKGKAKAKKAKSAPAAKPSAPAATTQGSTQGSTQAA